MARIITLLLMVSVGCSGSYASVTTGTQLTDSDIYLLQSSEEWQKVWQPVGSGAEIDITSTIPLSRQTQEKALRSLSVVLENDIKQPLSEQFDEKHFVKLLHFLLSERDLYVLGYAALTHHAMIRDSTIGIRMFRYIPYHEAAWKQLPNSFKLMMAYCRKKWEAAIEIADRIANDSLATELDKDHDFTIELACRYHLKQPDACERIMSVEATKLKKQDHRELLELYQSYCRDNNADTTGSIVSCTDGPG